MAIVKTIPLKRIVGDKIVESSEVSIISETNYQTTGEDCLIVRGVSESTITLDSTKGEHITIKAMTKVNIKPDTGLIDEEFHEIHADRFSCIELRFVIGNWYILSSDGLKQS